MRKVNEAWGGGGGGCGKEDKEEEGGRQRGTLSASFSFVRHNEQIKESSEQNQPIRNQSRQSSGGSSHTLIWSC